MKKFVTGRPICIILLILSALVLTFSLFLAIFVRDAVTMPTDFDPTSFTASMPDMSGFGGSDSEDGDTQQGGFGSFDAENMPQGGSFDAENMPEGGSFDAENMPEGGSFDTENMPEAPSMGGMQPGDSSDSEEGDSQQGGGFDPSSMTGGFPDQTEETTENGISSVLRTLKKAWIPMAISSFVVLIACIVRLSIIASRERREKEAEEEKARAAMSQDELLALRLKEEDEQTVRAKKRKRTRNIVLACVLAGVAAVSVFIVKTFATVTEAINDTEVDEKVITATVEKGDIVSNIVGAGSVSLEDEEDVTLPEGVEIAAWYVKNGDEVASGDVLARVDPDSCTAAIANLQSLIADLDEDLEEAAEDKRSNEITAAADGRVIYVYAEEGGDTADTVEEHGALAVLSLDGMLSVTVPRNDDLAVGDTVIVVTMDGTEYEGKVFEKGSAGMTVTVSDENPLTGETVTVKDEQGTALGSGNLAIHSEQRVTGYTGTVDEVNVSEGDEVEAEDVLLTLEGGDYGLTYTELLNAREDLVDAMRELVKAYASGYIYAETSGVVSGIDDDAVYEDPEAAGETGEAEENESSDETGSAEETSDDGLKAQSGMTLCAASVEPATTSCVFTGASFAAVTTANRKASAAEFTFLGAKTSADDAAAGFPEGDVTLPDDPAAGDDDPTVPEETDEETLRAELIQKVNEMDYETLMKVLSYLMELENPEEDDPTQDDPTGDDPTFDDPTQDDPTGGDTSDVPSYPNGGGGMTYTTTETEEEEEIDVSDYEITETVLCTVTADETVTVEISVDEQEIGLIYEGMKASISLDAWSGRSFEGTVKEIAWEGTNSGGSTKFDVTVEFTPDVKVLSGMNASVLMTRAEVSDVAVLPLAAVVEEGNKVFVYTAQDEESGELTDPVEVELGVSDGENVEILSGLSEGDTYVYRYADTITYNFLNR